MDKKTYYFSDFTEDEDLKILALKAKDIMKENDNVYQIFQINMQILCGESPKQVLFLMKENKHSIFSPSTSNENSPSKEKSYDKVSTPVRHNPGTSNMPKKYLPLDAEKEHHSPTLEFSTPTGHQNQIVQPEVEAILNLTIDKTRTSDEQFADQVDSTGNQESSPTAEITKMTTNLTMDEKECGSPVKVVCSTYTISQESSPSSEVSKMIASLDIHEKDLKSPKDVYKSKLENQKSPQSAEITRMTSNLAVNDKESINIIRDDQIACYSATNKDSPKPEEKPGKSQNLDSTNKYFISHAEELKISEPALIRSQTPSPVKRTKMCSISNLDTEDWASPTKKGRMEEDSPEDIQVTVSCIPGDKLNVFPNKKIKEIARNDRKRKSLSPARRSKTPFKSIPRVVKLAGDQIDIEVIDLEYGSSPTTSRSKSADYQRDSAKEGSIYSPTVDESKTRTSPNTPERYLCPQERVSSITPSYNLSGTSSPGSDDDVFVRKHPSGSPSMKAMATSNRSCISEYFSTELADNPVILKMKIQEFNTLLQLRDTVMSSSFITFQCFQTGIELLNKYVLGVLNITLALDCSGKFSTEEFKNTIRDVHALTLKLIDKIKWLKKNTDFELYTWQKCFHDIVQLKAQYEPLFTEEGKPTVSFENVQVFECKMREIWKNIDCLIMKENSRRSLLSHIAPDMVRLIKMIVKCLILVGILRSR